MEGKGTMNISRRDFLRLSLGLSIIPSLNNFLIKDSEAEPAIPNSPSVLVMVFDGADYRTIMTYPQLFPNLHSLYLTRLDCGGASCTKPGCVQLLTGLEYTQSKVYDNKLFQPVSLTKTPFYKLALDRPYYCQMLILSKFTHTGDILNRPWRQVGDWAKAGGMDYYRSPMTNPAFTLEQTNSYFIQACTQFTHPGLLICHWAEPDETGHDTGMDSSEYLEKLITLDALIPTAIDLVQPDVLIVTSDHGFDNPGAHGHGCAPNAFLASNLPLKEGCIRRDVGYTLHTLLGLSIHLPADPKGYQPWLHGKSIFVEN